MKKMIPRYSVLCWVSAVLLLWGCASTSTPGTAEASAALAQQKDIARQWAEKLKRDSAVDAAVLKIGEGKYREAASQNKGYLEAVANGIINNENIAANPAYKALAEKSEAATKDFVDFAKKTTGAMVEGERSVGAAVIAGVLVESGIAIWKAHRAETLAERQAAANRLVSQNSWDDWDSLK